MALEKRHIFSILIIIIGLTFAYRNFNTTYDGPNYIETPTQKNIMPKRIPHTGKDGPVDLEVLATYEISARVKHIRNYYTDGASPVSPMDLALVWGDLANDEIDQHIQYTQSNRWYYFNTADTEIIDLDYIKSHSANTHIIPSDEAVFKTLKKINKDDYVILKGYLVNVDFDGGDWNTSLTREDTGDGACEILYVVEVTLNK